MVAISVLMVGLSVSFLVVSGVPEWIHCDDSTEFEKMCVGTYKGVVVNGRCFFISGQETTFSNAWNTCQQYGGATFAQLQTEQEYTATFELYKTLVTQIYIPFIRTVDIPYLAPCIVPNSTYWLEGPSATDSQIVASATWIRTFERSAPTLVNEYCMTLLGDTRINDVPCTNAYPALCQITNGKQKYRSVPGVCVDDGVIQTIEDATHEQCAESCTQRLPCRGFSMFSNSTCLLVTWSSDDNPTQLSDPTCVYYKQLG